MKLPQLLVALAGTIVSIVLALQGATLLRRVDRAADLAPGGVPGARPAGPAGAAREGAPGATMNPFVPKRTFIFGSIVKVKSSTSARPRRKPRPRLVSGRASRYAASPAEIRRQLEAMRRADRGDDWAQFVELPPG